MDKKLLSIIIPTKNRQFYCKKAVNQILNTVSTKVQVIVQDNSDDESLRSYFDELADERIFYNYHPGTLSFVDNFSEAVSWSNSEYLCMIGDDDGVLSIIESVVQYMKMNEVDAFVPGLNVIYSWPSYHPFIKNAEHGYLHVTPIKNGIQEVNCKLALEQLYQNAFQDYQRTKVPRLYHGIVRRDALKKIKKRTGHYFGGLTPDMFMAVALSLVCEKVVSSEFPITISGMCPGSGSANSSTGAHTGKITDAPHFIGHIDYVWDERIPKFYSVETIWIETAFHALQEMGEEALCAQTNYALLYAMLEKKYPQFIDIIDENRKKQNISKKSIKIELLKAQVIIFGIKIGKALTGYRKRSLKRFNVENISEVEDIIKDRISNIRI